MNDHDQDPRLSALYRAARPDEPSRAVDERILAAARRHARGRRLRRWGVPSLATAALLVLGATVTLRLLDAPVSDPQSSPPTQPEVAETGAARERALAQRAPAAPPASPATTKRGSNALSATADSTPARAAFADERIAGLVAERTTAQRIAEGSWPTDLLLLPGALREAFRGAEIRREGEDGFLVLDGDRPALRFTGTAGGPPREIEARAPAARWLPWVGQALREAEAARERLACRKVQDARMCEHPDNPGVVFRFAGDSATTMTWTAPRTD